MIIPTKMVPRHKSLIYKGLILLNRENNSYDYNKDIFNNITEYFDVMLVLFSLGYLNDEEKIKNDIPINE